MADKSFKDEGSNGVTEGRSGTVDEAMDGAADGTASRASQSSVVDEVRGSEETSPPRAIADEPTAADEESRTLRDRLLRQAAEFQNFRRRVEQERKQDVKFGQSLVLQELLDVLDDLRRSIEAATDASQEVDDRDSSRHQSLREGVDLVYRKFSEVLQRFGVEPIDAVGRPFDEQEHEAMMQQPAPDDVEPGTVLAEIQKGYRMGDRVLRHSKVVVASDDVNG